MATSVSLPDLDRLRPAGTKRSSKRDQIVNAFLNAQFSGEDRHQRRLNKIFAIERRFVVRS